MLILGIDPGYAIIGYGVVEYRASRFQMRACGAIRTTAGLPFAQRLADIYDQMRALCERYRPSAMAVEKLFFNTNTTTALDVAQARGVILLAAHQADIPAFEYTPLQVKQAVTGYGRAQKEQVMEMTKMLLGLSKAPKPDDTADALALAICHAHTSGSLIGRLREERLR